MPVASHLFRASALALAALLPACHQDLPARSALERPPHLGLLGRGAAPQGAE